MVEVGKIGDKTLVLDGRYISIFKARELLWKKAYMGYLLPDGNLYMYRRRVRITELSGNTLTDYQIKIEIGTGDPIFAHARSAGEDIRFCYYPEEEMLSYWIEKYDPDAEEAIIWVKVPSIPASSEIEIYMYYGNPTVASASDGDATFEFFDDFEGTSIDTSKWERTDTGGSTSVSNSIVSISVSDGNREGWKAPAYQFRPGFIYESKKKFSATDNGIQVDGLNNFDGDSTLHNFEATINQFRTYNEGTGTITDMADLADKRDVWHIIRILWKSASEAKCEVLNEDYSLDTSATHTTNVPDENNLVPFFRGNAYSGNSCTHYWDWIRVRKYASPEPTVEVGAEE